MRRCAAAFWMYWIFFEEFGDCAIEDAVTVVKTGCNEGVDQDFSRQRERPEARNVFQMKEGCLSGMFNVLVKGEIG